MARFIFPKWTNALVPALGLAGVVVPFYIIYVVAYGFSPDTTHAGYQPPQPVPFSHAVHAGELGMDCRYCHTTVEHAAHAAIPPTQSCMNCHTQVVPDLETLDPLWDSYETGEPVEWIRVHDLPDYAYFDHSAHVNRGVSCIECHGRVDRMEVVHRQESLSMHWCLDCHRDPDPRLREVEHVTDMDWGLDKTPEERLSIGEELRKLNHINPSQDCSACHR